MALSVVSLHYRLFYHDDHSLVAGSVTDSIIGGGQYVGHPIPLWASYPEEAWREITVAEGSQGPRTYRFSAQRVRVTKRRKPGEVVWAIYRCNLDGSQDFWPRPCWK